MSEPGFVSLDQLTAEYPTARQPLLLRHKIEALTDFGRASTGLGLLK